VIIEYLKNQIRKCYVPFCVTVAYIQFENSVNSSFKVFLPLIQAKCARVTRVYDNFQSKLFVFIYFLTACLVANFKQPLWSN
jgi:hypothetical protein